MTQSFNPSNWFWILIALLVGCLVCMSSTKKHNPALDVHKASTQIIHFLK